MATSMSRLWMAPLAFAVVVASTAIPRDAQTKDLVVRNEVHRSDSTAMELVERQAAVYFTLGVVLVAQKVWSAFSWAVGLYGLAYSAYSVNKDCVKEYGRSDCINSSIGLVVSFFGVGYKVKSGFGRNNALISYGTWEDPQDSRRTSHIHVPLHNSTMGIKSASIATQNNGTWERHATFYWDGEESQYLHYRSASAEDLGFENDGTFHHFRLEDADEVKLLRKRGEIHKRAEKRSYGIVSDYLWTNNNNDLWQQLHDTADFNDMGSKTAQYMINNKQEASCLTAIGTIGTHGGSSSSRIDNGVIAYGWNDKPFDFNGRAGGWAESCKGSNLG